MSEENDILRPQGKSTQLKQEVHEKHLFKWSEVRLLT